MDEAIHIEVVYALPQETERVALKLPPGSTLRQALEASGLLSKHKLDAATGKFGIFGKLSGPDTVLRERDRVEIYRPLIADPKEVRRARAAKRKATKRKASGT